MNGDNRYVAMLNSDSDRRILDNNWFDNEWNSDNRFLFVRKSLHFLKRPHPSDGGCFVLMCFCQPPMSFPISFRRTARAVNFFWSRHLTSHETRRKNLRRSSFAAACATKADF